MTPAALEGAYTIGLVGLMLLAWTGPRAPGLDRPLATAGAAVAVLGLVTGAPSWHFLAHGWLLGSCYEDYAAARRRRREAAQ